MKEISAREAKNQFGHFLDWAQREPVRVTKRGRPAAVMMSEEQYQRLRGAAWEQLGATIDAMRAEAEEKGLTESILAELLDDES
jgi:prevent-host-death family protein